MRTINYEAKSLGVVHTDRSQQAQSSDFSRSAMLCVKA